MCLSCIFDCLFFGPLGDKVHFFILQELWAKMKNHNSYRHLGQFPGSNIWQRCRLSHLCILPHKCFYFFILISLNQCGQPLPVCGLWQRSQVIHEELCSHLSGAKVHDGVRFTQRGATLGCNAPCLDAFNKHLLIQYFLSTFIFLYIN